jgi:hypothetical protein
MWAAALSLNGSRAANPTAVLRHIKGMIAQILQFLIPFFRKTSKPWRNNSIELMLNALCKMLLFDLSTFPLFRVAE